MNENNKQSSYYSILMCGSCFFTAPEERDPSAQGSKWDVFESFDPRTATGIEIVEIDEDNMVSKSIEVSQTEAGWLADIW